MHFDAKDAFAAFYAIFWGVVLASMGKFGPFDIYGLTKGGEKAKKNRKKFALGFTILNVLPALWFVILLKWDFLVPNNNTRPAILAAASAALSVFAFLNCGYAVFGAKPWVEKLYTEDELQELESKKNFEFERTPSKYFFRLAITYIVVFPTLAILIGRLSCE